MANWDSQTAGALTAPQEVQVLTRRRDGTVRSPRTIWIVRVDNQVFIRSTNGAGADWYRGAIATGIGQIAAGPTSIDVRFVKAVEDDLARVDRAYRSKYGQYVRVVDHLSAPGPRSATLELLP